MKWSWFSERQAYWHLRLECHRAAWGADGRKPRHSAPLDPACIPHSKTLEAVETGAQNHRRNTAEVQKPYENLSSRRCQKKKY